MRSIGTVGGTEAMKTQRFILETSGHRFTATIAADEVAITCEPPIDVLALTNTETCDLFHWTEQDVFSLLQEPERCNDHDAASIA
jgi:hypothetical protein